MIPIRSSPCRHRHGSVIIIVLWAIAIAALVTTSVQLFSHRQATLPHFKLQSIEQPH